MCKNIKKSFNKIEKYNGSIMDSIMEALNQYGVEYTSNSSNTEIAVKSTKEKVQDIINSIDVPQDVLSFSLQLTSTNDMIYIRQKFK